MLELKKKPVYKKWWFIAIVVFFVISAIGALTDDGEVAKEETEAVSKQVTEEKTEVKEEKKEEVKVVKTPDVVAAEFIKKEFGTNKEEKERAVISTSFGENGFVEGVALQETYWSPKSAKKQFLKNTKDFMEKMQSQKDVTRATLVIQVPLTDQYGKTENGEVMRVMMNRETLDKIDFEGFDEENLISIADDYYEHQALSEE